MNLLYKGYKTKIKIKQKMKTKKKITSYRINKYAKKFDSKMQKQSTYMFNEKHVHGYRMRAAFLNNEYLIYTREILYALENTRCANIYHPD